MARPLAEPGDRVLAFLIDYAILSGVNLILSLPVMIFALIRMTSLVEELDRRYPDPRTGPPPDEVTGDFFGTMALVFGLYLVVLILTILSHYIYRVEMMFHTGQTLGKRVMRLRVVPVDPATSTLTRGMATRRWLVDSLGAIIVPMLFLVDGLWQYWDRPLRQCLHDKFAATVVVPA